MRYLSTPDFGNAGTIFDSTCKSLMIWFQAAWHVSNQKFGASALGMQKALGLGSYHTAWAWLHKFRRAVCSTLLSAPSDGLRGLIISALKIV
jgi:hypothetical protein